MKTSATLKLSGRYIACTRSIGFIMRGRTAPTNVKELGNVSLGKVQKVWEANEYFTETKERRKVKGAKLLMYTTFN